jgi:hypothetical protein
LSPCIRGHEIVNTYSFGTILKQFFLISWDTVILRKIKRIRKDVKRTHAVKPTRY